MFKTSAAIAAAASLPPADPARGAGQKGIQVNDAQSKLNPTVVRRIVKATSVDEIRSAIEDAARDGTAVSLAGGRHAMGGQQFGTDTVLLDTTDFREVIRFDRKNGLVEVQAGIQWPELIDYLHREQKGDERPWAIRQKQTGVDRVSIGGSLAANIHGRGLTLPPFVSDVESFELLDANGELHHCSRSENAELFSLAIGGYGLFGVLTSVTLRLVPRTHVQRVVEVIAVRDFLSRVEQRLDEGYTYGDCQYSTDLTTDEASHPGVFSCYRAVPAEVPHPKARLQLTADQWARLYTLARTDKKKAFEIYSDYYVKSSGQIYWSDTHQLSTAFEGYRRAVDKSRGTEMITEVYLPKDALNSFLTQVRRDCLEHTVDLTYGTIRLVDRDSETFLRWATEPCVCIVCNLHVANSQKGRAKARNDFRRIIDRAIEFGGRYYLTYHRWATRKQVETCYPQFVDFLRLKQKYDPQERLQSDWYRHYKQMFADQL